MAPQTSIPVAANILGTIGTVFWCIQLVPQIWYNWRQKKTDGLPGSMMFLWALCMYQAQKSWIPATHWQCRRPTTRHLRYRTSTSMFNSGKKMLMTYLELQYPYPDTAANILHAGASKLGSGLDI